MSGRLVAAVLLSARVRTEGEGRELLKQLLQLAPSIAPEVHGQSEPVRTPFTSIEAATSPWSPPFLWRHRSGQRVEGSIWFDNPRAHSAVYVTVASKATPVQDLVNFVTATGGDFGYVHYLTEAEQSSESVPYDAWYPLDVGVTTQDLRKGIPNICWGMLFGPPYVSLIGRDRLLEAPWALSRIVDGGAVWAQMTSSIDEIKDLRVLEDRRRAIRVALGTEYFLGSSATTAPAFEFPPTAEIG